MLRSRRARRRRRSSRRRRRNTPRPSRTPGGGRQGHRGGAQRLRADRASCTRAGGGRRRAHQGPGCTAGSAAAPADDPRAARGPRARVRAQGRRIWFVRTSPTRRPSAATVDRFLDELDAMASVGGSPSRPARRSNLRAASRDALAERSSASSTRWPTDSTRTGLTTLADDLTAVAELADRSSRYSNKHLAEPTDDPAAPKVRLVERCCRARSTSTPWIVLTTAASQRWSAEANLVDAHRARRAAGTAGPGRGADDGRRGRRPAVPVRPGPR